jgi:hypothetical protein
VHQQLPAHQPIKVERPGDPSQTSRHRPAARDGLSKTLTRAVRKKTRIARANCVSKDRGDSALAQDQGTDDAVIQP